MPKWTFEESFINEEGARDELSLVTRQVEEDIYDQMWFLIRILEVTSGTPVRQLTVSFEDGKTYSTEI